VHRGDESLFVSIDDSCDESDHVNDAHRIARRIVDIELNAC
jgi:hypothetical protein